MKTPQSRARVALLAVLAVMFSWLGFSVPAQAIEGTSVNWSIRQTGIADTVKLSNTSISGYQYKQSYQTVRNNVAKTCPPSASYKLQVPGANGMRFLEPGACRVWPTAGERPVGLFRANYTPPVDPPPPSEWPNAATTGVKSDPDTLPERRGWRVTTPGAVVENVHITSDAPLTIDAPNVTVRNVYVEAGIWGIDVLGTGDGVTIEDTTIVGGLQAGIGFDWPHADNWTVQRVELTGGNDGIKPGGSGVVRDSWIHDLGSIGDDPHNDAMQFGNAWGIDILHNNLECKDTSCIAMFGGQAQFDDVTIEGNKMGGAGYLIYAGGTTSSNIVIRNNTMGSYGYQHPVTDWVNRPGNVFSGNVFTNGNPVPTP